MVQCVQQGLILTGWLQQRACAAIFTFTVGSFLSAAVFGDRSVARTTDGENAYMPDLTLNMLTIIIFPRTRRHTQKHTQTVTLGFPPWDTWVRIRRCSWPTDQRIMGAQLLSWLFCSTFIHRWCVCVCLCACTDICVFKDWNSVRNVEVSKTTMT